MNPSCTLSEQRARCDEKKIPRAISFGKPSEHDKAGLDLFGETVVVDESWESVVRDRLSRAHHHGLSKAVESSEVRQIARQGYMHTLTSSWRLSVALSYTDRQRPSLSARGCGFMLLSMLAAAKHRVLPISSELWLHMSSDAEHCC